MKIAIAFVAGLAVGAVWTVRADSNDQMMNRIVRALETQARAQKDTARGMKDVASAVKRCGR